MATRRVLVGRQVTGSGHPTPEPFVGGDSLADPLGNPLGAIGMIPHLAAVNGSGIADAGLLLITWNAATKYIKLDIGVRTSDYLHSCTSHVLMTIGTGWMKGSSSYKNNVAQQGIYTIDKAIAVNDRLNAHPVGTLLELYIYLSSYVPGSRQVGFNYYSDDACNWTFHILATEIY